ncbi:integrase arm-type DNA-binding domain-containing protein [Moraxella nasovis]|uniref:tyrosine-type recombinase/integrase n=1 Tax=Moraxella nasovis TaxID=2904121 RepID=UPI001F6034DE|nr:site-specific integrase [Moraxella nasovis]UNU73639.1 integrase arm-type DNA-binding domain-containing protein [Moraxella nasovis]
MYQIKTDKQITALKDGDKPYFADIYGKPRLFIKVSPTKKGASKVWVYRYAKDGKQPKITIGAYPTVSMAQAFTKWQELNELIAQGIDPKAHYDKIAKEQERQDKNKFSLICMAWAKTKGWKDNSTIRRHRDLQIFIDRFGDMPLHQITHTDIVELLKDIEQKYRQRNNPELPSDKAERCRGFLVDMFAWACVNGYCMDNPTAHITTAKKSHILQTVEYGNRKALVKPLEFGRLMRAIFDDDRMDYHTRHNMLLLAYTGVRNGDIRRMKWADLDLDNGKWELTPIKGQSNSNIRMIEKMTVPLSRQVIAILQAQHRLTGQKAHVFAKDTKDGIISDGATNTALKRLGFQNKHSSHGFRSSAKTLLMGELDYNDMITEMMLGHVIKGDNPYMRADLYAKRCELMQTWADYIDDLAMGKDTTHYKGVYREKPSDILQALINMMGKDGILKMLQAP